MAELRRILVIEDDLDDQAIMQQAAEAANIRAMLQFRADGETALADLNQLAATGSLDELPDLILLDLNLPGMHGLEVLRAIRENDRLRCLPVVVMTTSSNQDDVQASYEAGANSYVTKPRRFAELAESLSTLEQYWRFSQIPRPSK